MPRYRVQDDKGRTLVVEGESPPTEQELEQLFSSQDAPAPQIPELKINPYDLARANAGGTSPYDPGTEFTQALAPAAMEALHYGLEVPMRAVGKVGAALVNAARSGNADPFSEGVQNTYTAEPGKPLIPELEPDPESRGILPSIGRFAAGLTTPENMMLLPLAPESKTVAGYFGLQGAMAVPQQVEALLNAQGGAETRGAITDLTLNALMTRALTKSALRRKGTRAGSLEEAAEVYGDVRSQPGQGQGEVPTEEGGARIQPSGPGAPATPSEASLTPEQEAKARQLWNEARPERPWFNLSKQEKVGFAKMRGIEATGEAPFDVNLTTPESYSGKQGAFALPEEDKKYLDAEREALDVPIEEADPDEKVDPNTPFAKRRWEPGEYMRPNYAKGTIEIMPQEFSAWLNEDLAHLTPEQKGQAVRTRLAEERIHLATDQAAAKTFWDNMTGLEKRIFERIYFGEKRPSAYTDSMMGAEALRYRIQQLSRMTPSELVEASGREKWTLKGLAILETTIRGIRQALRTSGRLEQAGLENDILGRVENKIQFAKATMQGQEPASVRRHKHDDYLPPSTELYRVFKKYHEGFPESPLSNKQAIDNTLTLVPMSEWDNLGMPSWVQDAAKKWFSSHDSGEREIFKKQIQKKIDQLEPLAQRSDIANMRREGAFKALREYDEFTGQQYFPAARRRGISQKAQRSIEEAQKLMARRLEAEGEEVPDYMKKVGGGAPVPAEERTGTGFEYQEPTPASVDLLVSEHLSDERPSFKDALQEAQANYGPRFERGALMDSWFSKLGDLLENASGERLTELVNQFKVRPKVIGPEHIGAKRYRVGGKQIPFEEGATGPNAPKEMKIPDAPTEADIREVQELRVAAGQATDVKPSEESALGELFGGAYRGFKNKAEAFKDYESARKLLGAKRAMRNRAIAAIWEKMHEEAEGGKELNRREVNPDELRWSVGPEAYQEIPTNVRGDISMLGDMLTKDARTDATTKEAVAGGKTTQRRTALPESATRRITVLLNQRTGKVHLVSTYRHGRQGPVMIDPGAFKETHRPIAEVVDRYTPIRTMLLDEPVQNYHEVFKSMADFNESFGDAAKERASQAGYGEFGAVARDVNPEGTPGLREAGEPPGSFESDLPITTPEAKAAYELFDDATNPQEALKVFTDLSDRAKAGQLSNKDRMVVNALRKVYDQLKEENDKARSENKRTEGQLVEDTALRFYDIATLNPIRSSFIERTKETLGLLGEPYPLREQAPSETGKELEVRSRQEQEARAKALSTLGRRAPIRQRPIEPAGPQEKIQEPEEPSQARDIYKEVRRQQRERARLPEKPVPERIARMSYEDWWRQEMRKGGGSWPNPQGMEGQEPAARRRKKLNEEMAATRSMLSSWIARRDTKDNIAAVRDAADNSANTFADQVANSIRLESASANEMSNLKPFERFKARQRLMEFGNKQKLAAANALVAAGAIETRYPLDLEQQAKLKEEMEKDPRLAKAVSERDKEKLNVIHEQAIGRLISQGIINHEKAEHNFNEQAWLKLDDFLQKVQRGKVKAQNMIDTGGIMDRRRGSAWLKAAEQLEDEVLFAKKHWQDDQLRDTARKMVHELQQQYDRELKGGYAPRYDDDYIPGRYDAEFFNDNAVTFGDHQVLGRQFRDKKTFKNYYDAIEAGPYIPATRNGADIVGHRVRQGQRSLNKHQWVETLKTIKDPATGKPVAMEPKEVEGDAKKVKKPDANYDLVRPYGAAGDAIAVRKGFVRLVKQLTNPSEVTNWAPSAFALEWGQKFKHAILIGDFFHLARLTYYGTSILGRRMGWKGGLSVLEFRPEDMDKAVERGIIRQQDADWANTPVNVNVAGTSTSIPRINIATGLQKVGLNVGRIQDALYKDLASNIPGVGTYNKFLFDKLTRGVMLESAVREFERLNQENPNVDLNKLMRDVARDTNNYYGNIGRQGLLKSQTMQDFARLFFLAPQWVEGLARKEASFYGRGTYVSRLLGRDKELPAFGVTGRGMARGMATMFLITQALNLATRGKTTFQNDEEDHKLDAWIPDPTGKTPGFWLSPLSVFNELSHDLIRFTEADPFTMKAVNQITQNKLSVWGKIGMTLATLKNQRGEALKSDTSVAEAVGENVIPLPITASRAAQSIGHMIAPGAISKPPPGSVQRQLFGAAGLKVEPAQTATARVFTMAQQFMDKPENKKDVGWENVPTDEPSYSKLRRSVRADDPHATEKVYEHLRQSHTDGEIITSMKKWAGRPFTGSNAKEKEFIASMTDAQLAEYQRAVQERQQTLNGFIDWFVNRK